MASAAYAVRQQNSGSDARLRRSQFKVIEGGLSRPAMPETLCHDRVRNIAPSVPEVGDETFPQPHPKHSGPVCFLVALSIALAICVVSVMSSNLIESRIRDSVSYVPSGEYFVVSGDSLWSIAESHPIQGHSASEVVTWIMERNNLENGLIVAGQCLAVPSQSS